MIASSGVHGVRQIILFRRILFSESLARVINQTAINLFSVAIKDERLGSMRRPGQFAK